MAELSFLHFPEQEDLFYDEDDVSVDDILAVDSLPYWSHICSSSSSAVDDVTSAVVDGVTSSDRKNQVSFVMDLFHQRVEQSHVNEQQNHRVNCFDVDLGLGLGFQTGFQFDDDHHHHHHHRVGSSARIVGIDSDTDSDTEEISDLIGFDVRSEEDGYAVENVNGDDDDDDDEDVTIPLCWDSFQLDEGNNDFEWEEVDGRVDEREVLTVVDDPDDDENEEGSISMSMVLPMSGPEEGRAGGLGNLEWEVLLDVNNLGRNHEVENDGNGGLYFGGGDHDDFYTAEYEMMFGQFADVENAYVSRPPASRSVVERLPSVVMTEEDVVSERALCAVCKDHIGVGEEGKQLPCSHRYHGECVVPWLGIRNTCPVCRYELPTDDPDYEQRRIRSASRVQ